MEPGQETVVTPFLDGLGTRVDAELERQLAMVDDVLADQAEVLRALASR